MKHFWLLATNTPWYKEGEGNGDGQQPPKTFTQEEVEKMIQGRLSKQKQRETELLTKLKSLETKGLSDADREALEQQIQQLQEQNMSKEELFKERETKLKSEHDKILKKTVEESTRWKGFFESSSIRQAITAAAISAEAENVEQMLMMFQGSSRLEEEIENNKPTGRFIAKMKIVGIDPDTKAKKEFDLPVAEAITKLREDGLNANLFKHKSTGGTGTVGNGGTGSSGRASNSMPQPEQFANPAEFQVAYTSWRQKYNLDGSERKI
jgi:hypothetical protein